jgi:hypothetical protein
MRWTWTWAGTLLLFTALAVWILDFDFTYLGARLPGGLGDPVLVLYFMEWGKHSLANGLRDFWDANFYFPATGVMARSDHLLGPAAIAAGLGWLGVGGVAAYDLLFLGSYVLSGVVTAWVLHQDGASGRAAVLSGILFAFSPYRSSQESHIQVLIAQWIPLTLWYWDRLLAMPSLAHASWFVAFYLLHTTGGSYLAYFLHLALAIVLLQHWREWRTLLSRRSLRVTAPAIAICGAVTLSLFLPYMAASRGESLRRSPDEVAFYSASLESYFSVERENVLWGRLLPRGRPENSLFAGAVGTVFAVAGGIALVLAGRGARADGSRRRASSWERGVLWSGAFFFLLSFAPVFLALARVLPGLQSMRVPTRGYPFVSLALAVLAARGFDALLERWPRRRTILAMALALALCVELDTVLTWHAFPPGPEKLGIFQEIARRPEVRAVLHLPMVGDGREAHYMYYSKLHWKPIANGYSGYAPASYLELERRLKEHPLEDATVDYLIDLGVTHVGTHPLLLHAPRGRRWLARWERRFSGGEAPRIRCVATAGDDRLYELLPRSGPPS